MAGDDMAGILVNGKRDLVNVRQIITPAIGAGLDNFDLAIIENQLDRTEVIRRVLKPGRIGALALSPRVTSGGNRRAVAGAAHPPTRRNPPSRRHGQISHARNRQPVTEIADNRT
ncbi:hypothetical protein BUE93_08830 [Chromobacterium amazonense]|uniref:Uncharacterized protein n=1 Tax=Chromobacterium amazonense TaxID=1382803 RepID=A0A2S9X5N8_9NEIS|nr:hypothetical protein BUE93_08830 [Chromobacterium amazonense]